jgi:hypothetical protein
VALSRRAAALLILISASAPATAQTPPPPDPVTHQQVELREIIFPPCPRPVGDEIVVCARRESEEQAAHRLPLPVERAPSPADRAGGEQRAALAVDTSPCTTVGRNQRCSGGLDLIGIGVTIARGILQAARGRD